MANQIYPGSTGAPAFASYQGISDDSSAPPSNGAPADGGTPPVDHTPPSSDDGGTPPTDGGDSGLISVDGSNGGIDVDAVDTNGDDHGLVDVHSDAPGGVVGDALDGTHIDIVNEDSLVDAHVPGVLDATIGDGTVSDLIDGVANGDGLGNIGDLGSLGGLAGGLQGIEVNALQNGNLLDVHAPNLIDVTVGGGELDGLIGSLSDTVDDATGGGGLKGITAEVLNGENIAEVHAADIADATVGGGGELDGLLGALGGIASDSVPGGGDLPSLEGINVDVLNGEYVAEAHAPSVPLDATVGGAELGNLVGGVDLGGLLDGGILGGDGGILGDALQIESLGDIAGVDLGHTLDSVAG